jgi:hypothetical protein
MSMPRWWRFAAAWPARRSCWCVPIAGTRENALVVFDRTFAITVALQLLATVVAFIGIFSTLMSLQLERSREIGVLRATGMTRRQLWRLSLLETGLVGATAGLLAMPTGFCWRVILIYIINLRSFGWTLEMRLAGGVCAGVLWWRWWRRCSRASTRRGASGRRSRRNCAAVGVTARAFDATLWTQDEHFQGLAGVKYIAKPAGGG